MLNRSKGPAVHVSWHRDYVPPESGTDPPFGWRAQGPRAQIDRKLYKREMQAALKDYPNLTIRTANVKE